MNLKGIREYESGTLPLYYDTVYPLSWSKALDFQQSFFDDIADEVKEMGVMPLAGGPFISVTSLANSDLRTTPEFAQEAGCIVLGGKSKVLESMLRITVFNQSRAILVDVFSGQEIIQKILQNNHLLDNYMSSLEIHMVARDAKRAALAE